MKKVYFVIDEPSCCAECQMRYLYEELHLGDFKYQKLFRCKIQPEDVEDIYLEDIINKKPKWCPLKSVDRVFERMKTCAFEEPLIESGIEVGKVKVLTLSIVNEILDYEFGVDGKWN